MLAALVIGSALLAAPVPSTVRPGDSGADVSALQRRLQQLRYDPGEITGRYGSETKTAVWAFQKVNHLAPSGTVGKGTWQALEHPRQPHQLERGPQNRVEVDIRRQLLTVYKNGGPALISHISTGRPGWPTPTGDFRVERRVNGWRHARLGWMYRPLYFHSGFALHGSASVPLRPASHGCVRLPMYTADRIARLVPNKTRVYVTR